MTKVFINKLPEKHLMSKKRRAWIITASMGYGHQRAAFPLREYAQERVISVNSDDIISDKEQRIWNHLQRMYEGVSHFSSSPLIGDIIFSCYDSFQKIRPLYPFRDLSFPNLGALYMNHLLKKGICQSLISYTKQEMECNIALKSCKTDLPFVTTFYLPAIAANRSGIPNIFCIVTDTDVNRVWVPMNPATSTITYLVPTAKTAKRLKEYGIADNFIHITGFPLPKSLIGTRNEILQKDLSHRLRNLDPKQKYEQIIKEQKGIFFKGKQNHPLTLTYMVGGAGAQIFLLRRILYSLRDAISKKVIRMKVCCGTHVDIADELQKLAKELGLKLGSHFQIQISTSLETYFETFTNILHETDILVTKPSELSFYAALGIPILCTPPLGAHEEYNLRWLEQIGCGMRMDDPETINEWLFDWLNQGVFAKASMDGYLFAEHRGTYNIEKIVFD